MGLVPQTGPDDDLFALMFEYAVGEGAVQLLWEQASRCSCYTADSEQPVWGCQSCGGSGVVWAAAQTVTGLFRARSEWLSFRRQGELEHGEAQLTTPLNIRPGYVDRRVRDRFTVAPTTDGAEGRRFYVAAPAVPFIFNSVQRAWRCQLQNANVSQQLNP